MKGKILKKLVGFISCVFKIASMQDGDLIKSVIEILKESGIYIDEDGLNAYLDEHYPQLKSKEWFIGLYLKRDNVEMVSKIEVLKAGITRYLKLFGAKINTPKIKEELNGHPGLSRLVISGKAHANRVDISRGPEVLDRDHVVRD